MLWDIPSRVRIKTPYEPHISPKSKSTPGLMSFSRLASRERHFLRQARGHPTTTFLLEWQTHPGPLTTLLMSASSGTQKASDSYIWPTFICASGTPGQMRSLATCGPQSDWAQHCLYRTPQLPTYEMCDTALDSMTGVLCASIVEGN